MGSPLGWGVSSCGDGRTGLARLRPVAGPDLRSRPRGGVRSPTSRSGRGPTSRWPCSSPRCAVRVGRAEGPGGAVSHGGPGGRGWRAPKERKTGGLAPSARSAAQGCTRGCVVGGRSTPHFVIFPLTHRRSGSTPVLGMRQLGGGLGGFLGGLLRGGEPGWDGGPGTVRGRRRVLRRLSHPPSRSGRQRPARNGEAAAGAHGSMRQVAVRGRVARTTHATTLRATARTLRGGKTG